MSGAPHDEQRAVLRARARALARRDEEAAEESIEVLAFRLAHETYAMETTFVREVCLLAELAPVPCTPEHIAGLINLRGQILTVVDVRRLLSLPDEDAGGPGQVIVVRHGALEAGILADAIVGIGDVPADRLEQALPAAQGPEARYVKGVIADGRILLDAAALLDDPRLAVDEEVEA